MTHITRHIADPSSASTVRGFDPCRICGTTECLSAVYDFGDQPVAGYLEKDEATARQAPRFPLVVALCTRCALLQQASLVARDVLIGRVYSAYQPTYSASSDVSSYVRAFLDSALARGGVNRGDAVVEVGSNDGTVLRHLAERGMRPVGFEPSSNLNVLARTHGAIVVEDYFGYDSAVRYRQDHPAAQLVLSRHTFEHTFDPLDCLRGVECVLADEGLVMIEVPYIGAQMVTNHFEAMTFQHVSFFSVNSMTAALERAGLHLVDVAFVDMDGGSFVIYARKHARDRRDRRLEILLQSERQAALHEARGYADFFARVGRIRRDLPTHLASLAKNGVTIVAYGGGGKGQSLLNMLGLDRKVISYAIDDVAQNALKYVPGTGIQVVPSRDPRVAHADVVFITAPTHVREVVEKEAHRAAEGTLFLATTPDWHYLGPTTMLPRA